VTYKVKANLELEEEVIKLEKNRAGRFVLATNILDKNKLTSDALLKKYKEQQAAERGFAFLKDPLFFADSIFLKNPQRIETMAMLMGLCLLVLFHWTKATSYSVVPKQKTNQKSIK